MLAIKLKISWDQINMMLIKIIRQEILNNLQTLIECHKDNHFFNQVLKLKDSEEGKLLLKKLKNCLFKLMKKIVIKKNQCKNPLKYKMQLILINQD